MNIHMYKFGLKSNLYAVGRWFDPSLARMILYRG